VVLGLSCVLSLPGRAAGWLLCWYIWVFRIGRKLAAARIEVARQLGTSPAVNLWACILLPPCQSGHVSLASTNLHPCISWAIKNNEYPAVPYCSVAVQCACTRTGTMYFLPSLAIPCRGCLAMLTAAPELSEIGFRITQLSRRHRLATEIYSDGKVSLSVFFFLKKSSLATSNSINKCHVSELPGWRTTPRSASTPATRAPLTVWRCGWIESNLR